MKPVCQSIYLQGIDVVDQLIVAAGKTASEESNQLQLADPCVLVLVPKHTKTNR